MSETPIYDKLKREHDRKNVARRLIVILVFITVFVISFTLFSFIRMLFI